MLAGVHRLVQVLDPLLDGREVLGLGELDEVGRLAHRDLGDHLQGGGGARAIAVAVKGVLVGAGGGVGVVRHEGEWLSRGAAGEAGGAGGVQRCSDAGATVKWE